MFCLKKASACKLSVAHKSREKTEKTELFDRRRLGNKETQTNCSASRTCCFISKKGSRGCRTRPLHKIGSRLFTGIHIAKGEGLKWGSAEASHSLHCDAHYLFEAILEAWRPRGREYEAETSCHSMEKEAG